MSNLISFQLSLLNPKQEDLLREPQPTCRKIFISFLLLRVGVVSSYYDYKST